MELSAEKLYYLIYIYHHQNKNTNLTKLSLQLGVSKSTLSRLLKSFYEEGLIEEKGKILLSRKGLDLADYWNRELHDLQLWLKSVSHLEQTALFKEAIALALSLSKETRKEIINQVNLQRLFETIKDLKIFKGDLLHYQLNNGEYPVAFSIYKKNHQGISMANDAFDHPGKLVIDKHQAYLRLVPIEIERAILNKKLVLKGRAVSLEYLVKGKYYKSDLGDDGYLIDIKDIDFYYSKNEQLLQGIVKIRVQSSVGIVNMPESEAILNIIVK